MRWMATAALILGLPVTLAAQRFEFGGSISKAAPATPADSAAAISAPCRPFTAGCGFPRGSRSSCASRTCRSTTSGHSTYRDDRLNLGDDPAARPLSRIDITTTSRSRRLVSGEVLFHFVRDGGFGAVLGAGLGDLGDRGTLACLPAGCERVLAATRLRRRRLGHTREQSDDDCRALRPGRSSSADDRRRPAAQFCWRKPVDERSFSRRRCAVRRF